MLAIITDTEVVAGVTAVTGGLVTAILYLFRENRKIEADARDMRLKVEAENSRCQQDLRELRVELVSLNALMEQAGWSGGPSLEAIIVANSDGVIVEWNPGATILFHYTAREMLGKNVLALIPQTFREAHLNAITTWRAKDEPPRRGPFQFYATTKEGYVIPVEITLSGWQVSKSKFVAATIRRRLTTATTVPEPTAPIPSKV